MTSEGAARRGRRPEVGLADLLRALETLDTEAAGVAEAVGKCLGFGDVRLPTVRRAEGYDESRAPEREARTAGRPTPRTASGAPPLPAVRPELPPSSITSRLLLMPVSELPDPQPPHNLPEPLSRRAANEPPFQPLFARRTAPALLASAIATRTPGSEPDLPRILARLGRLHWLDTLPTLPRPGLERGVDLLMDSGEGMRWLMDDLRALSRQVRAVVGEARCRVYSFRGDPASARRRRRGAAPEPWTPAAGRPVLVATRFGAEPPAGQRDAVPWRHWRRFARDCRRDGVPLIALVPQRPALWPDRIGDAFVAIHWDHRTRAGTVRNAVGRGHRVDR